MDATNNFSKQSLRAVLGATILSTSLLAETSNASGYRSEVSGSFVQGETCTSGVSEYTPPAPGSDLDPSPPVTPPPTGTPAPPTETPGSCEDDYDGFQVAGKMFVTEVDTSRGPLALAPYLSRASSVGAGYGQFETDSGVDIDSWELEGRFVTDRGIVFEAQVGASEFDGEFFESEVDHWGVAGGYYVAQDTQLRLGYTDEDADFTEATRWSLDITHVQQMENGMTWSLHALAGWVSGDSVAGSDDGADVELNGQWFFRNDIGVGVDLAWEDRDISGDYFSYSLHGEYWLTEKISLTLLYKNEDFDAADVDVDSLEFKARYRF